MKIVGTVLVLQGGSGARSTPQRHLQLQRALQRMTEEAYAFLERHSAIETVVFAVARLEDESLFNAGTGSTLQQDGHARMSASIMDGASGRFSAVLNIERVRNPVRIAEALLVEPDRVLAGEPARRFARTHGFGDWNPITPERLAQWRTRRRLSRPLLAGEGVPRAAGRAADGAHGTVGACALDAKGRLAAATSTGGKGFERSGRVSDSGMPAGNYATGTVAVSCTGVGEDIMEEAVAPRLAQQIDDGAPLTSTMSSMFRAYARRHRRFGAVALDRRGRWAWATTLPVLFAAARSRRGLVMSAPCHPLPWRRIPR